MSELTQILSAINQGDRHAAGQLLPLVYDQVRQLAGQKLSVETPGQTLQPTALAHEAYLRLVGDQEFDGRGTSSPRLRRPCAASSSRMPGGRRP